MQVGKPVAIVIACRDRFGIAVEPGRRPFRQAFEGCAASPHEDVHPARFAATGLFVRYDEIEPAIIVEIDEGGAQRRLELQQPQLDRRILEMALPVIAQQRIGQQPACLPPCAAHQVDIGIAIIVEIAMDRVEPARQPGNPGPFGRIDQAPVRIAQVEQHFAVDRPAGGEDIELPVAIEILDHRRARIVHPVDPGKVGNIGEFGPVIAIDRAGHGQQVFGRDIVRIAAQRHMRDVEQPLGPVIVRPCLEHPVFQHRDGLCRTFLKLVLRAAVYRYDAGTGMRVVEAVLLFAQPQIGDGQPILDQFHHFARCAFFLRPAVDFFEDRYRPFGIAFIEQA